MQIIRNLIYKPTANNADYVAQQPCDGNTDANWTIFPIGSIDGSSQPINPNYVTVDNLANGTTAVIAFGPYSWLVPAYSRKSFRLPIPTQQVILTLQGFTTVNVLFVENPNFSPDDQNYLAIQEAARGVALFPFVTYNAVNSAQQRSDANCVVEFVGVGINIVYTLLDITGSGSVLNGWFQFVFNNGNLPTAITPFGGDTINGIFNNANAFLLYPGEYGILSSDGAQWFCKVFGQKLPSSTDTTFVITQKPSDLFKRKVFSNASGQTYNLLTSTIFTNGDRLRLKNAQPIGGGVVAVTPSGVERINGTFLAGSPLFLYPGDEIDLLIDDTGAWAADGIISWESADLLFGESFTGTELHNMGGIPENLTAWVRCVAPEINYVAGDVFKLGIGTASTLTNGGENVLSPNATGAFWCISPNNGIRLPNKTSAVSSNIATTGGPPHLTNFRLFFTAQRRL